MIFQTQRLYIRLLDLRDLEAFHEMQSNPNVLRYVSGEPKDRAANAQELKQLIEKYTETENDYWVWAVVQKSDDAMAGTCAIVKNEHDEYEIGYRLLERYWGEGYGSELTAALAEYGLGRFKSLVAYVDKSNIASVKILDASRFEFVKEFYNEKEQCMDRYYRLEIGRRNEHQTQDLIPDGS